MHECVALYAQSLVHWLLEMWNSATVEALKAARPGQSLPPASTPPACAWTVPGEKIKDPDEEDDGDEPLVPTVYVVASVIFAAASVAYHYLVGF